MVYNGYIVQICESIQLDVPGFYSQGGTLIFSYIRRLGPFFGVKFLNFNIFWGFQKYDFFGGMNIL